ncbi:MAG: hypothetical protein ACLTBV_17350 [Enterocloster bolteae]
MPGLLLVCNAGEEVWETLKECVRSAGLRRQDKAFVQHDSSLSSIVDRAVGSKRCRVKVRTRGGHSYNDFGNDNAIAGLASWWESL